MDSSNWHNYCFWGCVRKSIMPVIKISNNPPVIPPVIKVAGKIFKTTK
jgi:hypothetical protein